MLLHCSPGCDRLLVRMNEPRELWLGRERCPFALEPVELGLIGQFTSLYSVCCI